MRKKTKGTGQHLARIVMTIILLLAMTTSCQHNRARAADSSPDISELKTQNELLQQRSRFTTGSVVMIFGIVALLAFLAVNSRWTRRLELKNRQLQRERNVVVAQNKQLAIERDRAEAASKAKTSFIQSMTHEIRTPLNAISGFTQVLTMPGVNITEAERNDCCQRIQDNTRMLTNIVDDLIFISDIESSSEKVVTEPCMAAILIEQPLDMVKPLVAENVKLNNECNIPMEQMIETNAHLIHTILNKLLDNAAKFTTEGSITLCMSLEDEQLHFSVADTGPGIPEDKKDYIFERFTKLDSFAQGTGLGLAIARMTAEHLGGSLTLDTAYHEGTKIDLFLPAKESSFIN